MWNVYSTRGALEVELKLKRLELQSCNDPIRRAVLVKDVEHIEKRLKNGL